MTENEISSLVIGAAIDVHKQLGPGLLESSYEICLAYELKQKGLEVNTQVPLPIIYKKVNLETGYRIDLLIEKKVIIEVKAVEEFSNIHLAQILTYLKLSELKLGLLLNFNVAKMTEGIKRVVNRL